MKRRDAVRRTAILACVTASSAAFGFAVPWHVWHWMRRVNISAGVSSDGADAFAVVAALIVCGVLITATGWAFSHWDDWS